MSETETSSPAPAGEVPSVKRVAILGTAPSSRPAAPYPLPGCPFDQKDWEVWCVGLDPMKITSGWHRWYEIHSPEYLIDKQNPDYAPPNELHVRWLQEMAQKGAHIRLLRPSPTIPEAKIVDRQGIIDEWPGPFAREFRNSTIAWMMAEAILEGAAEIGLWGVDMALASEYQSQRSGVFFFLDQCFRRNIKVHLPPESDLFYGTGEYPECGENPIARKLAVRRREIIGQMGQAQSLKMQAMLKEATTAGALETHDWFSRTFINKG